MNRLLAVAVLAATATLPRPASAAPALYYLDITVTSAPTAPGFFLPWTFGSLPQTYRGVFTADDTMGGAISNLQLVVGGVDVVATHNVVVDSLFEPSLLYLQLFLQSTGESAVLLGRINPFNAPLNYAAAVENNSALPLDTYYPYTQNWAGTYAVTPAPEPSTWLLVLAGCVGLRKAYRAA